MDEFNFLFSLFGLLLGFAMAELVAAFGRALRAERTRVGWLSPLLSMLVLIDIASFWLAVWELRDRVHANMATLLTGLAFCAGYYLIALQAAPPERESDGQRGYWRVRTGVAAGLIAINLATFALQWLSLGEPLRLTPYVVANVVYLALLVGVALAPGPKLNAALLTAAIALFGVSAIYGAVQR